jgi:hypothetical protein
MYVERLSPLLLLNGQKRIESIQVPVDHTTGDILWTRRMLESFGDVPVSAIDCLRDYIKACIAALL